AGANRRVGARRVDLRLGLRLDVRAGDAEIARRAAYGHVVDGDPLVAETAAVGDERRAGVARRAVAASARAAGCRGARRTARGADARNQRAERNEILTIGDRLDHLVRQ